MIEKQVVFIDRGLYSTDPLILNGNVRLAHRLHGFFFSISLCETKTIGDAMFTVLKIEGQGPTKKMWSHISKACKVAHRCEISIMLTDAARREEINDTQQVAFRVKFYQKRPNLKLPPPEFIEWAMKINGDGNIIEGDVFGYGPLGTSIVCS